MSRRRKLLNCAWILVGCLFVASLSLHAQKTRLETKSSGHVKTTEQYWAETGLADQDLQELLVPQMCQRSPREFLACVNAILVVAQKYGVAVGYDGSLHKGLDVRRSKVFAEQELLAPWQKFVSESARLPNLSFTSIWEELSTKYVPADMHAYSLGTAINGYLSVARDPHTYILPGEYYNEVVAKASHRSVSIGLVIGRNDKNYFIKKIIEDSAADEAGLRKGDLLVGINGQEANSLSPFEITSELKGELGTTLKLKILREGSSKVVTIVRSERNQQTVSFHMLDGIKPFGVLTINKFATGTCESVKNSLSSVASLGLRGLLLDLRDNPGGQMNEAACVTSLFLGPGKKVFEIKLLGQTKADEIVYTSEEQAFAGPMAVLVNSGSASAAEILAGALKDHGRAVLVGERTFGKGSFQEGMLWAKNKKIAFFQTKGFYFLPSGMTPQLVGLDPDVKVSFKDQFALRESEQYVYPLHAEGFVPTALASAAKPSLAGLLPSDIVSCVSFESDFLSPEDPEIREAHRILNCRGIAGRGEL